MGRDDLKNVALQFSKAIIHFISLDSDVFDAINKVFIRCYIYIMRCYTYIINVFSEITECYWFDLIIVEVDQMRFSNICLALKIKRI